jgi:enamine deaminase RidA (YjgF/YER057c/UK114 family)
MQATRGCELAITVKPAPDTTLGELFGRLATVLKDAEAGLAHLTVFGNVSASSAAAEAMRRVFGAVDWPVTWVEGAACEDEPIAGIQAVAFAGGDVRPIRIAGRVIGSAFEDGAFRHCLLGGIGPAQKSCSRSGQARQTFDHLAHALEREGFSMADVIRTWFFLDDILGWYGEFNKVRTEFYSRISFGSGSLPASTGVSGRNPDGSALAAGAWAARPLSDASRAAAVASPLQCPAPAYGSSFSRAMELSSSAGRRLLISGTASIAPDGRTLRRDDARGQIQQTMRVVEAILRSRNATFRDLSRATAYFKHGADAAVLADWCGRRGLDALPLVMTRCDICRGDLLFELEVDVWRPAEP